MDWDPKLYARFAAQRGRPFDDLLARIDRRDVARGWDLGCGDGRKTRRLAERWPTAHFTGVDQSAEMLAGAESIRGRLDFARGDIATWSSEIPADLIFSNAAFHWITDHDALVGRLVDALAPGGTLAVQMPDNFDAPSHLAIDGAADEAPWRDALASVRAARRRPVRALEWYVDRLLTAGLDVDAWATSYVHLMPGPDAIVDWLRGTAMRPFLDALDAFDEGNAAAEFVEAVRRRIAVSYPATARGSCFEFRRIFFVASRPS